MQITTMESMAWNLVIMANFTSKWEGMCCVACSYADDPLIVLPFE